MRHVDPAAARSRFYRAHGRLVSTRLFQRLALTGLWGALVWPIDRVLLRLTRGRLCTASPVPTNLLETRGARSGQLRRNAVVYFHDGGDVIIVASNGGRSGNPAWYYNARANPEVVFGGMPFRAEVVKDPDALWPLADRVFPAFAAYRATADRAGREVPIVRLAPGHRGRVA